MKIQLLAFTMALTLTCSHQAFAQSLVEEDYEGKREVTTPWYTYVDEDNIKADQGFITAMRPHHAGALTMSKEYLTSDKKSSERLQALAHGIIRNQTFEISMLDTIEDNIKTFDGPGWQKVADKGLAKDQQFVRAAPPAIQKSFNGDDVASAEDVRFAKAMIVHHEGALDMAKSYLYNPDSNNGYLKRMNLDILRDQVQEIRLMHNIIASYPGDPAEIKLDPKMIDGMDHMLHGMDFNYVLHRNDPDPTMRSKPMEGMEHMNHGSHHGH